MPFRETCPVEERIALVREYGTGAFTVSELCQRHGISRETFYVWKRRRESGAERWWEELSHAAVSCPHRTDETVAAAVISTASAFPISGRRRSGRGWRQRSPAARGRQPPPSATS